MWKYKYLILPTNPVLNIDRCKHQEGNACGHISQCQHKNHIHTHTHTNTHVYVVRVTNKTNYVSLRYILVTSSLLSSLSYIPIILCLHPVYQIAKYDHLLISLALKGWYPASQHRGMEVKFLCFSLILSFKVKLVKTSALN